MPVRLTRGTRRQTRNEMIVHAVVRVWLGLNGMGVLLSLACALWAGLMRRETHPDKLFRIDRFRIHAIGAGRDWLPEVAVFLLSALVCAIAFECIKTGHYAWAVVVQIISIPVAGFAYGLFFPDFFRDR